MNRFKDAEHLLWAIRALPGRFRRRNRGASVIHAGHETCETCHAEVLEVRKAGRHAGVNCEACHGTQGKHAEDPGSIKPVLPDTSVLCPRCHEANPAKPKWFPAVVTAEHSQGLPCYTCHTPHNAPNSSGSATPGCGWNREAARAGFPPKPAGGTGPLAGLLRRDADAGATYRPTQSLGNRVAGLVVRVKAL